MVVARVVANVPAGRPRVHRSRQAVPNDGTPPVLLLFWWNPVTGCTKITLGCDFCYAERFSERFRGVQGHPFENGFDLTLRPERLAQPVKWRQPRRIFVNSMSDLFHKEVPTAFIDSVFET